METITLTREHALEVARYKLSEVITRLFDEGSPDVDNEELVESLAEFDEELGNPVQQYLIKE